MIDAAIKWSLANRYVVCVLALIVLIWGACTTVRMPVDVFPDFAPVQVVVMTEAQGFAPLEVESLVTRPLEAALSGTIGVKTVRSTSTIGLSVITIIFNDDTNIFVARQLVAEKVQTVRKKLPDGIDEPALAPITSASGDVIKFGFYQDGTDLRALRTLIDYELKMRLLAVQGVSNVVVIGGDQKQYQVLVDPRKLRQYGVSLAQVAQAAGDSNTNAAGGIMRDRENETLVRGLGRVVDPADIADAVITARDGTPVDIGNVAEVRIGSQFKVGDAIVDGHPGIVVTVFKQPGANTLDLTRRIESAVQQVVAAFPADAKMVVTFRQADFIEVAIKNVAEAVAIGALLVVAVLLLFLQQWRTAFISLTAIPLSLLAAIIVMDRLGLGINTMTLGGLAIAIGEVVDDAIIDVENVHRRMILNDSAPAADKRSIWRIIFEASSEVRSSVVYATCIVALVFLPILSLSGLEGKIFAPLAWSYLAALMASLVVALTVTPALCLILLRHQDGQRGEGRVAVTLKKWYRPVLAFCIQRPRLVLSLAGCALILSIVPVFLMGKSFLPSFDENNLVVVTSSAPGTSLDTTLNTGKTLISHLEKEHGVVAADQRAGRAEGGEDYGGSNTSEYDIRLPVNQSNKKDVMYHLRHEFAHVPGLVTDMGSYLQHRMDHALSGVNAAIAIKLYGNDLDILHQRAKQIEATVKTVRGAVDVHVEPIVPVPQISVKVDRLAASRYGISVKQLSRIIETAFKGEVVSQVIDGQKAFDIVVWLKPEFRDSIESIQNMLVDAPGGIKVPLGSLAEISRGTSPNTISHENVSRRVIVQANISGRDLGSVVQDIRGAIAARVPLPTGFFVAYGGQFEAQEEATRRLGLLSLAALLGMVLLLIMAFKSLRAAALIMANLPLALIGGIWAVFFTGAVLSVGSLVGFITLFGISCRNGIMLVTHFNALLSEGRTLDETIELSALDRLNAVLMTALTAALGVAPIAVLGGAGRELEQPLAIVILGGMITATLLTLVVIPSLLKLYGSDLKPIS